MILPRVSCGDRQRPESDSAGSGRTVNVTVQNPECESACVVVLLGETSLRDTTGSGPKNKRHKIGDPLELGLPRDTIPLALAERRPESRLFET